MSVCLYKQPLNGLRQNDLIFPLVRAICERRRNREVLNWKGMLERLTTLN